MILLDYPNKKPSIKSEGARELIFCLIRRKWFVLTPEEWVRQNILLYLTEAMGYPASLIAVEKQVMLGELKKRFDIVVYKNEIPFMLIECKELNAPINQKTMDQALRYNIELQAAYCIISNGNTCFGFKIEDGSVELLTKFPLY
ncbi:MAG: type I restriction enzyme HsdR N-terminal domain-containing protein [Ferruginibacter sp.]